MSNQCQEGKPKQWKPDKGKHKDTSGGGPFMGRMMLQRPTQWGNKMLGTVEEEVERLVNNSYLIAKSILQDLFSFV